MKRLIFSIVIAIVFLVLSTASYAEDVKIGYVNLSSIFEDYKKVADSNKKLEEVKKQVKNMLTDMQKLKEGFDALSDEAKEERKNEMVAKQEDIRRRTVEVRKDEDRILREILKDIENVTADLRKKEKLTYIIDDRLIIAGPKDMDLTEDVIKLLNERYKAK